MRPESNPKLSDKKVSIEVGSAIGCRLIMGAATVTVLQLAVLVLVVLKTPEI